MAAARIPSQLRKSVEGDARNRCGYCLTPASFMPIRFEIEQIIGRTAIGRATIEALKLNHPWWIECRAEWVLRGNFPPTE